MRAATSPVVEDPVQRFADRGDGHVAGRMPLRVVDLFQSVDVDEGEQQVPTAVFGVVQVSAAAFDESTTVQQIGHVVGHRHLPDRLVGVAQPALCTIAF